MSVPPPRNAAESPDFRDALFISSVRDGDRPSQNFLENQPIFSPANRSATAGRVGKSVYGSVWYQ